jgi:peptidoglycan/LPS O-acetylase OafA/YrhL
LLLVTGLLTLIGPYLLASPVDPSDFAATTGVDWEEFSSANPEAAEYLAREARILGIGYMGFALFALAIIWSRLRRGDPWAAKVLWILPVLLALTALVFLVGDGSSLAVLYGAMAVVVAVPLLAARKPRGSEST